MTTAQTASPVTFWFTGFNHSLGGRDTLIDIQYSIAGQLRDLGFNCGRDPGMEFGTGHVAAGKDPAGRQFINIIFEGFHPGIIDEIRRTKAEGAHFICIMTEQPGKRGFNDVPDQDMIFRQKFFKTAAPMMDAIWCLVPGADIWARRFNRWSMHMETGYSAQRVHLLQKFSCAEPLYDVAFYGGMTQRRWNILQALRERGFSVLTPPDLPMVNQSKVITPANVLPGATSTSEMYADIEHRNQVVSLCRCVVELKPNPKREYPSSTRLNVGLHLGRPCVVEKHPIATSWRDVVDFADGYEDFFAKVGAVVADYKAAHARQMAAFQRVLSSDNCVGKAIRDTKIIERLVT